MTPKKAIVIVLILFLITAMVFVFLYLKQQLTVSDNNRINIPAGSTNEQASSSVQQKIEAIETKTREQVEEIAEQGRTATGGVTKEAAGKIDDAINQSIIEQLKLKTPEQLKAEEQRRAEQEKADQEINRQIQEQMQNK